MKKLLLALMLLSTATTAACSQQAPGEVQQVEVTRIVEVDVPVEVVVTREVMIEIPVEVIVEVTPAPSAIPQNFVFLEYSGTGEGGVVTDNFSWPACQKAVFIAERTTVSGNFIVYGINVDTGERQNLFLMGRDEDRSETLAPLTGGTYYLEVDSAPVGEWSIIGECRD